MTRDSTFQGSAQTLFDNERAVFTVYRVDRTGAIVVTNPVAVFNQIMIQSAQEQDGERTQTALASDAPKLYAFGRQHRFFTYQGFILDSKLDHDIETTPTSIWSGRSYAEWRDFYENFASLSACAKNRYLVQMTYPSKQLFGALNQMSASMDASQPNRYEVVFSFYVTHSEDINVG